ncbi:bifunctional folylpolyglutamate synthase/dihydrofolate synthase [Hyphococcus flavus]|uniref:Dihydrofolate synthase/folylpolyglutamate synthase n=1 Tax=Hyphococcus flavus TaxID=1866326 RepID=A0AAE9ZGJ6_9PROT|nr:folylpolyglutamate synthase/dihydrofolate synthase family protein [Hyphococcus flavus]WDI32583.1 bifunctional folylpolyglutamate synthase/dihydrofolate synthase [Hyphococcus flavus]
MSDIESVLARIANRRPVIIDLSLDRIRTALSRLGNPQRTMPPVFHVAGTNGKGSTVAFIRSILESAGNSVHVYTSPHLVRFNERIAVAGKDISNATLIDALERTDAAMGDNMLTYFETTTCAALLAFAESTADYAVIEVGLGGRLDATNVFDEIAAAVVTPVDLDHQQFLGDKLSGIAVEKAGIFKRGAPAVISPQSPEAMAALQECARNAGADTFASGEHWNVWSEHGRLIYQDETGLCDLKLPRLPGAHQIENAGAAIAAIRAAGLTFDDATISKGIELTHWPARLQRLTAGPLIDLAYEQLGESPEIWLDGGHNPHAGRAVARAMADMEARHSKPLVMVSGMQANKDAAGYFAPFNGIARKAYCVAADHEGVMRASEVRNAATNAGLNAESFDSIETAFTKACAESNEPPRFLISGSLYLAGEILHDNS